MKDIEILLQNKPGELALLGETLSKNKISLEGGEVYSRLMDIATTQHD